jgi:hypothetical protein
MKTSSLWASLVTLSFSLIFLGCISHMENKFLSTPTSESFPVYASYTATPQTQTIQTKMPTPWFLPTDSPKPTNSPTPIPSIWPLFPTMNREDSQSLLNDLLANNAGCRLPCFWGITPGKTTYESVLNFLKTFTMILGVTDAPGNIRILYSQIPFTEHLGTVDHSYIFKNNVVDEIQAYNYDLAPAFYMPAFLETYGQPKEVWISTYREEEQNSRPFLVDLFYPDQGILMEYSGGKITDLGDRLQNCLEEMNSPFIYLWAPDQEMTFDEAKKRFLYSGDFKRIPLKEATGIDVEAFYTGFKENGSICIETRKDLWP